MDNACPSSGGNPDPTILPARAKPAHRAAAPPHAHDRIDRPPDVLFGPLPHAVDFCRHGRRGFGGELSHSRPGSLLRAGHGRHDQSAHRGGAHPHDVSAAGQSALRGNAKSFLQPQGARALAAAKLDHRSGPHVRPRRAVSARSPGLYGRAHSRRHRPLHCHGAGLEPAGQGKQRVLCRARGAQQRLPNRDLRSLRVGFHHVAAGSARHRPVRGAGLGRQVARRRDHRANFRQRDDLPRDPVRRRCAEPRHPHPAQGHRMV